MKRFVFPIVLLALAACSQAPGPDEAGTIPLTTTAEKTYTASTATIANPERGFYHAKEGDCNQTPFDVAKLVNYRVNEKITLVRCVFYLPKTSDISAQVTFFRDQAARVRTAGLKMVLRFAYTKSTTGDDVPVTRVQEHLTQLTQVLRDNSDVIAVVESGFVGAWGEGYYTQNFGNKGVVSSTDWANRKAVVDKLLSILPSDPHPYFARTVLVRTPKMKRTMYGTTPVSSANAFKGTPVSRVGHYNDCFLASSTDFGTYENTSVEYPYLEADTKYVPMGGETCAVSSRSNGSTALKEMAMFHYSYLNRDYHPEVLGSWSSSDLTQVEQRLGHRLYLTSSKFSPNPVTPGTAFTAEIKIRNSGWAAPINPRPVYLGIRRKDGLLFTTWQFTGASSKVKEWHPSSGEITLTQSFMTQASLPAGEYKLLLYLPDGYSSLADNPAYALQMANVGTWEKHPVTGKDTGWNDLQQVLTVK